MKKQNSFFKAGALLALSGILVKAFSAVYRIPLTRMLGADTMGRYSAVFSLFMPFFSFATAGIATSVAHFTAKFGADKAEAKNIIKNKAIIIYMLISLLMASVFILFSKFYSVLQKDNIFFYGSIILAPSLALAALENVLKGASQGQMNMLPTALANVIESVVKTTAGLLGVWCIMHFLPGNKDDAAVMVCLVAITAAGFISALFLFVYCRKDKKTDRSNTDKTSITVKAADMLKMSVPISVSALTISLAGFFDTAVCLPRINAFSYGQIANSFNSASFMGAGDMAMYLFGIWQGMVMSVFNLTPAVVSPVAAASLPLISKSWALRDKKSVSRQSTKLFCITSFLSVPATMFVFCFGGDIIQLLFDTTQHQSVVAVSLLRIVCFGGIFCCFGSTLNTIMYAADRSDKVFSILLSACIVKSAVSWLLCGMPQFNIKAFAVSTVCFYTIIFMRSICEVKKLGVTLNLWDVFAIPALSALSSLFFVKWLFSSQLYSIPLFLRLIFAGVIFIFLYLLMIVSTGFLVDK